MCRVRDLLGNFGEKAGESAAGGLGTGDDGVRTGGGAPGFAGGAGGSETKEMRCEV